MADLCKEIDIMINKYINNELDDNVKLQFFNHIRTCKVCREELVFMIKLNNIVKERIKLLPKEIERSAYNKIKQELVIKELKEISNELVDVFNTSIPTPNIFIKVLNCLLFYFKNVLYISLTKI